MDVKALCSRHIRETTTIDGEPSIIALIREHRGRHPCLVSIHKDERDGTIISHADVSNGLAHEWKAVRRSEEFGCRFRAIGKAVVNLERLRIGIGIWRGTKITATNRVIHRVFACIIGSRLHEIMHATDALCLSTNDYQ